MDSCASLVARVDGRGQLEALARLRVHVRGPSQAFFERGRLVRDAARDEDHGVVEEPLRQGARERVLGVVGNDRVRAAGALLAIHVVKACLRVK